MNNKVKAALMVGGGTLALTAVFTAIFAIAWVGLAVAALIAATCVVMLLRLSWEITYEELEHRDWMRHRTTSEEK